MLLSPSGRWHSPCKRDGGIRACVRIAPRAPYTNVTQQEEFRSDTSAVVGSTPTISTKICGVGRDGRMHRTANAETFTGPKVRILDSAPSTSFTEEKTMYFIVRYNWQDKLTNKCSVGFFRSLKNASKFCTFNLPYDKTRNTVAIVKCDQGQILYSRPVEVFEWSDTYQVYIPVTENDTRRLVVLTY